MRKLKYIILALCITFASCGESFLDRAPISNMNDLEFYKSEKDIQTALVAAYQTLHNVYGPEGLTSFYGELMSDNAYTTTTAGNVADYLSFQNHAMRSDNVLVLGYWDTYYQSIFRLNTIIAKLEGATFANKDSYDGEAKFLRAMYYFDMVRAWGRIQLITKPILVSESYATPVSDEGAVYEHIISDLNVAAANLPAKGRFVGAATSGAANTLLGKVYLTVGKKSEAATVLNKVYGKYSLVKYADLWDLKKKNNAESIFEIQYMGGKANPSSKYWAMFTPLDNRIVTKWGGGMNQVTNDLWNAYESGDMRRDLSIFDGYTESDGSHNPVRFARKWVDTAAEVDGLREAGDNNFILLRYADVLLMLTEATGDASYLNEVRTRAAMPNYGAAGYPTQYNTVDLAVEHERQVEFALEFHRFFDLKRTGRAITVLKNSEKNITIDPKKMVLPIPNEVILQNPTVIKQNDGY